MHNSPQDSVISKLQIDPAVDITRLFSHFAEKPWSMLLDSANSRHQNGRYDLFVAEPVANITSRGTESKIWRRSSERTSNVDGDPIGLVDQLLQEYFPLCASDNLQNNSCPVPFSAGAIGYFGYDLARVIEQMPDKAEADCQAPDLAIGIYTWAVVKDNQTGAFYLCTTPGFDAPTKASIESLAATERSCYPAFTLTSDWQSNMDADRYQRSLAKIDDYLRAGDCYQVNFAQRFQAKYHGSPYTAYLRLRSENSAPFSAYINLSDTQIICISPERFLSVKDGKIESKPIKGTRPRDKDPDKDLAQRKALENSEKDKAENLMIVDLLRNDISRTCLPGTVSVPDLFKIESFAAVHHLVSTVNARLDSDVSPLSLLRNAFPGGSITGAPKIRAMEIIDELEPNRRNIYCGSIGYINRHRDMDTNICIRTLLCENNNIFCWAGGGIVLDSDPASEYQESFDKVARILPVLSENYG